MMVVKDKESYSLIVATLLGMTCFMTLMQVCDIIISMLNGLSLKKFRSDEKGFLPSIFALENLQICLLKGC